MFGKRRAFVRQLVLGLGEEPEARDVGEHGIEDLEPGVGLVVQARHHDRALGHDRRAGHGRPEQVRREDHRVVAVGVHDEVAEQAGNAEQPVEPRELVGERDRRARLNARLDARAGPAGFGALHEEAVHDDTVVVGGRAGRVLVAPGVVIARAGGEHFDFPAAPREAVRGLAHHRLGTTDDLGAVARRNERDPTAVHVVPFRSQPRPILINSFPSSTW